MAQEIRIGNGKYKLIRKFGGGSFGELFKGVDIETKEVVAVKLEPKKSKVPQLVFEARLLKYLHHACVTTGLPKPRWYGQEGEYNVLVMDLLGPSLDKLISYCGKKFSPKTACMLAIQMLCRVEFLHAKSFIHRDIKPDNFVMGTGKRAHHVYMIDFGLSKKYRDPKTLEHIPFKEGKKLTGTARYVSVYTHLGIDQTRRDDMESLAYVFIYFTRGTLPWQGVTGADREEKYGKIGEKKMSLTPESLCKFQPPPMLEYLKYCKSLEFDEQPDYERCRQMFQRHMASEEQPLDWQFDWGANAITDQASAASDLSMNSTKGAVQASERSGDVGDAGGHKEDDLADWA